MQINDAFYVTTHQAQLVAAGENVRWQSANCVLPIRSDQTQLLRQTRCQRVALLNGRR